jgi:hypothetical protein
VIRRPVGDAPENFPFETIIRDGSRLPFAPLVAAHAADGVKQPSRITRLEDLAVMYWGSLTRDGPPRMRVLGKGNRLRKLIHGGSADIA